MYISCRSYRIILITTQETTKSDINYNNIRKQRSNGKGRALLKYRGQTSVIYIIKFFDFTGINWTYYICFRTAKFFAFPQSAKLSDIPVAYFSKKSEILQSSSTIRMSKILVL
jgi:hypothetical protein